MIIDLHKRSEMVKNGRKSVNLILPIVTALILKNVLVPKNKKYQKRKKTFLLDHRSSRGVFIGSINFQSTIKKRKKFDCQKRSLSTEKNISLSDDIGNLEEDIT